MQLTNSVGWDYATALGVFIDRFSQAEGLLYTYLIYSAQIPVQVARVLVSGSRAVDSISSIKKLWEIYPPPEAVKTDVLEAFERMGIINTIRNSLLHYGGHKVASEPAHIRVTSDEVRKHILGEIVRFRVSTQDLHDMADDLLKIAGHVFAATMDPPMTVGELSQIEPHFAEVLIPAWRYTPQSGRTS